jgi:hypothetical protein
MSTESIVPDTIDDAYPVAGQDNDSQGFRDNFNIIKTNTVYTKAALQNLDDNTAKTNADNLFFENVISRYISKQQSVKYEEVSNTSDDFEISLTNGHHFSVSSIADRTLTFVDWTDHGVENEGEYQEMILYLKNGTSDPRTITFASKKAGGTATDFIYVQDNAAFGGAAQISLSLNDTDIDVVKAYTYDQGINVFLEYLGKFIRT